MERGQREREPGWGLGRGATGLRRPTSRPGVSRPPSAETKGAAVSSVCPVISAGQTDFCGRGGALVRPRRAAWVKKQVSNPLGSDSDCAVGSRWDPGQVSPRASLCSSAESGRRTLLCGLTARGRARGAQSGAGVAGARVCRVLSSSRLLRGRWTAYPSAFLFPWALFPPLPPVQCRLASCRLQSRPLFVRASLQRPKNNSGAGETGWARSCPQGIYLYSLAEASSRNK